MASVDFVGEISASVQDGGWSASGEVFNDADRLVWDQAIEIWFDLYRGGSWEPEPRLGFRGHLLPEDWEKRFQSSTAGWRAFTTQEYLKRIELQGVFFAEAASPSNQHQLAVGDTYADIVEHLLGKSGQFGHWNGVIDIWPEGFTKLNIDSANSAAPGVYDMKAGNFWSRLQEIAEKEFHLIYVGKDNTINYQINGMFQATLPDPVMDITGSHLLEPLKITPRNTEQVGQLRLYGTTPGGEQISGKYPTDATAGPVITESGFMATSNSLINSVAQRKYDYANRDVSVVATLPGAVGLMFEIMDRVSITYSSAVDGVSWSAKKFWIEEIQVRLTERFSGVTTLRLEAENV